MGTLLIPGMVTFVPLFVLVANLGLVDSYPGLILPFLVTPFGVFLMRQFIIGLPDDLLDAGRVDGASELRIFRQIILPLCGPGLATLGILTFLGSWNNFLWPLVVAQTQDYYTLPVALALFSTGQNVTPTTASCWPEQPWWSYPLSSSSSSSSAGSSRASPPPASSKTTDT